MVVFIISLTMANDDRLVERIAFGTVLCAGFVYVSYNVVSKMCLKKSTKKENNCSQTNSLRITMTRSTQTADGLTQSKPLLEDGSISPKSVRERVNDLNLSERLRKKSVPVSPDVKPKSFHGTPWSSPLGCAKYLSMSAENISMKHSPSGDFKDRSKLASSQGNLDVELHAKLSKLHLSESISEHMMSFQDDVITLKTLNNLQKSPSQMTAFEVRNLVHLLHSTNEDILLRTLSTISNCAAFTSNQELLCESDCPKLLKDLLLSHSEAVKIGVTQAISNVSVIDRSHRYFQAHIPILLHHAINGRELLKSLSLTALANLALDPTSHKLILKHVHPISLMTRNGTAVVQLQSLRLLVNLSCNKDIIPLLLMSEVPADLLDILKQPYERELVLRLLTFLANIATFAMDFIDGSSSRPTLISVLYHFSKKTDLSELLSLSVDADEDISYQAKRLHNALIGVV